MTNKLPDLTIKHRRIENSDSIIWNLTPMIYKSGIQRNKRKKTTLEETDHSPLISESNLDVVKKLKIHAEGIIESGGSVKTISNSISDLKRIFYYADKSGKTLNSVDSIRKTLFAYSEHQFTRATLKKIKYSSAYSSLLTTSSFLNGVFENLNFDINQTRLKKEKHSRRALSRNAETVMLSSAARLANFCFELTLNFDPLTLRLGSLPILVEVNNQKINLTPPRKRSIIVDKDFVHTEAYLAFNFRVSAEVLIFLAMTGQNQAPTYNLKRSKFDYKPLGEKYEIREYKNRRGGEVLFKIPKPYKPYFESYLAFLDEYAPDSEWLFSYLEKYKGFRKKRDSDTNNFNSLCLRYDIPWVKPSAFRSLGENILLRLSSDEQTSADYANHTISIFRQSYEFPSLQRAMVEVGRFWNKNDPLTHGRPTVSLFNSPCNGVPVPIKDATDKLPLPDCINPTGCIGCLHYRDEESLDYVWGLRSFKYLKTIESSSHRTKDLKPSNIAIDWANLKINWFKNSKTPEHREWFDEAEMRIQEGDYHPNWNRKIEKYEG
jgi:hypothetical protein